MRILATVEEDKEKHRVLPSVWRLHFGRFLQTESTYMQTGID